MARTYMVLGTNQARTVMVRMHCTKRIRWQNSSVDDGEVGVLVFVVLWPFPAKCEGFLGPQNEVGWCTLKQKGHIFRFEVWVVPYLQQPAVVEAGRRVPFPYDHNFRFQKRAKCVIVHFSDNTIAAVDVRIAVVAVIHVGTLHAGIAVEKLLLVGSCAEEGIPLVGVGDPLHI